MHWWFREFCHISSLYYYTPDSPTHFAWQTGFTWPSSSWYRIWLALMFYDVITLGPIFKVKVCDNIHPTLSIHLYMYTYMLIHHLKVIHLFIQTYIHSQDYSFTHSSKPKELELFYCIPLFFCPSIHLSILYTQGYENHPSTHPTRVIKPSIIHTHTMFLSIHPCSSILRTL